jgi:hypothetical protein
VLTINGINYDFGAGLDGDFFSDTQQTQTFSPSFTSLTTHAAGFGSQNGIPGRDGVFYLDVGSNTAYWTQAFLTVSSVPGPIVGTGLPAFILLAALVAFALRRRPIPV